MSYILRVETTTHEDADGNITETKMETATKFQRNEEPDYVKLYTRMWTEFNDVPHAYRGLFLELAMRMSYANSTTPNESQIVYVLKQARENIMATLKWKPAMLKRGLTELVKCGAIKRLSNGVYQINPSYAGKGEWKYNPRLERGGIEDIVATFSMKDKTVDTKIIWADDGRQDDFNEQYRQDLGVMAGDKTVLKTKTITEPQQERTKTETKEQYEIISSVSTDESIIDKAKNKDNEWNGKIYNYKGGRKKIYLNGDEKIVTDEEVQQLMALPQYIAS